MENNVRKLTRSTTDRRIAGVCGGLANYLTVDPVVLRVIFLISLVFGGLGFWAYLVIWLIAPEDNRLNQ